MSYENVKLVKLVSGDTVMGLEDSKNNTLNDLVLIQAVPTSSGGMQIAILPFGFPYEDEISGKVAMSFVMYEYTKVPEELKNKYIEAKSNIKIASGIGGLGGRGGEGKVIL